MFCHYMCKKTHTNINVRERSNHPESRKRAVIKGFADRARALFDNDYLEKELCNIKDVFVANGYPRERVRRYRKETYQRNERDQEKEETRRTVTIPYRFKRIASRHSFRVAFKPGRKLKEIKFTCQEPLGEGNTLYKESP